VKEIETRVSLTLKFLKTKTRGCFIPIFLKIRTEGSLIFKFLENQKLRLLKQIRWPPVTGFTKENVRICFFSHKGLQLMTSLR